MTGLTETIPAPDIHQLTQADLTELAGGRYTGSLVRRLRAAELSKNVLLLEAVRREAIRAGSGRVIATVDSACAVLRAAQAARPEVVAGLLTLPGFGLWAAESVMRLRAVAKRPADQHDEPSLEAGIGHLAAFAAVAALRSGQHCRLRLPAPDDVVYLPTLGRATLPPGGDPGWADFVSDDRGAVVASGSGELHLPAAGRPRAAEAGMGWTPAWSVAAESGGLRIRLSLEDSDPFLARLVPSPSGISPELAAQWQQRLEQAWRLLVRHHADVAHGLAEGLTAIVPSAELRPGQPVTATSGWAWGAVMLSLPPDELSFAEALTHEFHHLVLAAVEDITTLIGGAPDDLCYAPWRDDPRPRSALLQGSYAFFGVAGFWLRQSRAGSAAGQPHAQVEFARRSQNVADALTELRDWAGLTAAGNLFVSVMADQLAGWLAEPVTPSARVVAQQVNAEHRARWHAAGHS